MRRRRFIELSALSLASALLLACDSEGPRRARPALRAAERWNEKVERALFRHRSMDYGTAVLAGAAYPKYFVSDRVPVWDETKRGPWSLEVTGLVDAPMRLSLADLQALPSVTQRVNHYCVEGWTAVVEYTGVRVSELAHRAKIGRASCRERV